MNRRATRSFRALRERKSFRAQSLSLLTAAAIAGVCALTPGCAGFWRWPWGTTQRWPEPMEATVDPLPPGDSQLYPPGPEDVLVVRHADPVQVRPAGMPSSFPLSFYNKSLRVSSGSAVYSAPGGRVEVIWPSATSVVLFGRGSGIIGSKSRGEPTFIIRQVERAEVSFKKEDQIELLGGSQLSAHSGPFILDHTRENILRVRNQSKAAGQIAYREANFVLDPGQVIDLPLLSAGSKPSRSESGLSTLNGAGFRVEYSGQVEVLSKDADVALRALGEDELHAMGVRVRAERDEEVRFGGLTKSPVLAPPKHESAPTPNVPSAPSSGEPKPANPPSAAQPNAPAPEPSKTDKTQPAPPQDGATQPAPPQEGATKPAPPQEGATKPAPQKGSAPPPDASKPVPPKDDTSKPDASKPAPPNGSAPTPEASKPAPPNGDAPKPAPPKDDAPKPDPPKSETPPVEPPKSDVSLARPAPFRN